MDHLIRERVNILMDTQVGRVLTKPLPAMNVKTMAVSF